MPGEFVINPSLPAGQQVGLGSGAVPSPSAPGTIMGMTPQMFASVVGQLGAAISPEGTASQRVGNLAANMGSQKIQQLAMAEKDKKQEELYKEILKRMTPEQVTQAMATGSFEHAGGSADQATNDGWPGATPMSSNFNLGTKPPAAGGF